ncbi:hypothetical protein [Streptomyces sp. SA15]|uniref:hypothetical protein n=1 Tax=Streptomyces sp. SA15 TaxID=934019 RepID=UPI0027B8F5E9|nr:hypothetical protein [Streptomyces sp. SA15]
MSDLRDLATQCATGWRTLAHAHARVLGVGVIETCVLAANVEGVRFAEARGFVEFDRYVVDGESDLWLDLRLESAAA